MLVGHERVVERHRLFEHVEHVVLHAALQAEHDVEIAQADVGIDQRDARAALRERRAEVRGGRRLADAALARRDDDRASELGRPALSAAGVSPWTAWSSFCS